MKLAVIPDMHFRGKKLEDKKAAWEATIKEIITRKIHGAILPGDTFDKQNIAGREQSLGSIWKAFVDPLSDLSNLIGVTGSQQFLISMLLGNHEIGTGLSALEPFKNTNIGVIDGFKIDEYDDCIIAYIPWVRDDGRNEVDQWLQQIKERFGKTKGKMKIVIGHLTVRGAQLNSGIRLMGSEFELTQEQLESTGADLIVLGHIHKRQQIGDRIWYVGTLSQNDFGEEGNPSGFLLIDTEARTHEFIDIEAPKYHTIKEGDERTVGNQDYIKYRFSKKPVNYDELITNPNVSIEIIPDRTISKREVDGVEAGRSDKDLLKSYLMGQGKDVQDIERIAKVVDELSGSMV